MVGEGFIPARAPSTAGCHNRSLFDRRSGPVRSPLHSHELSVDSKRIDLEAEVFA